MRKHSARHLLIHETTVYFSLDELLSSSLHPSPRRTFFRRTNTSTPTPTTKMASPKITTVANKALRGTPASTRSPRPTFHASATHMGPPHYFLWRQPGHDASQQISQGHGARHSRSLSGAYQSRLSGSWDECYRGREGRERLDDTLRELMKMRREDSRGLVKQLRWVKRCLLVQILMLPVCLAGFLGTSAWIPYLTS